MSLRPRSSTSANFYPRPPRGGRQSWSAASEAIFKFLSTPSARRATPQLDQSYLASSISIHALREEGDAGTRSRAAQPLYFYTRPPRGGRLDAGKATIMANLFLSTPSARRATQRQHHLRRRRGISIHALREEGDQQYNEAAASYFVFLSTPSARRATTTCSSSSVTAANFYPRPPRGGRQQKQRQNLYFQTNYTTFCTNLEEP